MAETYLGMVRCEALGPNGLLCARKKDHGRRPGDHARDHSAATPDQRVTVYWENVAPRLSVVPDPPK